MIPIIKNIKKWWPVLKKDKDWHYGNLLYVINHKLKMMEKNWGNYTQCETQIEELKLLIKLGDELIQLLIEEEKISHVRSKKYKDLNNKYFECLKKINIDIYY